MALSFFIFLSCAMAAAKEDVLVDDDFVLIQPQGTADFSSLAARYLDNSEKDWLISNFNDLDQSMPQREVVIPLRPFEWGGLRATGYQLVPVLSYNQFAPDRSSNSVVRKKAFESQMDYLKRHGFRVITMDNLLDFLDFKTQIPEKSVVITIDGGWKSTYDIAYPILKKYRYPATLFLRTDVIGKKKGLSWHQVRELSENGVDIQCGTNSHHDLVSLVSNQPLQVYLDTIKRALIEPKESIRKQLGKECRYLAYPRGKTNSLVIAFVKKYGYRAAFTKRRGSTPFFVDNYRINRSSIHGEYRLADFKKNLLVFQSEDLL
jgi:peptidoglycan/xylan/chitin deacetylase (PgdA/CDA1 family)